MNKSQKIELQLKRSFAAYLGGLEYSALNELESANENLKASKESGHKEIIEACKLHIKCIQHRLDWIEDQKLLHFHN